MFAVQYKEGDDPANYQNLFMSYGSYLRKEKKSFYSSLSKLFFIQKQDDRKVDLIIDGQSVVDAEFHVGAKPAVINVNGKNNNATFHDKVINVSFGFQ